MLGINRGSLGLAGWTAVLRVGSSCCDTRSPRPKLIRLAHYCSILTGGQLPSTLVGESLVVEEPKRKPDLWWIESVVLLAVSVLGLVYPLWTNSNSH